MRDIVRWPWRSLAQAAISSSARRSRGCVDAGARAVLVACTAAEHTLAYLERLVDLGVPCGAYANAGIPAEAMTPERYADLAAMWIRAGASIVGACCGTGPAHIRALSSLA
jgi:S-methylmethionine-dependent homocysteine/selenocysteine methylase